MSYIHGTSYDIESKYMDNITHYQLRPYGSSGGQIFFSFVFMVWICLANVLIMFLIIRDSKLRSQPHNVLVFFIGLCDLTMGIYYLPVNMDFLASGQWSHGCTSLQSWVFFPIMQTGMCTFTVGFINLAVLCYSCSCSCSPSKRTRLILYGLALIGSVLYICFAGGLALLQQFHDKEFSRTSLWTIGLYAEGEEVTTTCNILHGFDYIGRYVLFLIVFWVPAYLSFVIYGIALFKLTRPGAIGKGNTDGQSINLKVLLAVTLVSLVLPGPFIFFLSLPLPAQCACLLTQGPDFTCDSNVGGVYLFLQWVLLAKSGVLPLVWYGGDDYRTAVTPILKVVLKPFARFRRPKL